MTRKNTYIIAALCCLYLQACATTAPVPNAGLSDQAEPAVTCDNESSCDSALKQKYQYYMGLWSAIFVK